VFAQDITKYEACLGKEYKELEIAVKAFEDLKQAKNEKLETYTPKQGFKDENFELFCKNPLLPSWASRICDVYELGQKYNKTSEDSKLFGIKP